MVTVPEPTPLPPSRQDLLREQIEAGVRIIIAGSSVGAVRRIVLYGIALVAMAVAGMTPGGPGYVALVGVVVIFLLAATDRGI